jgi:hypothetical protein
MRAFVAVSPTPTLAEWAKTSVWAADTGGARDDSSSPIRAQVSLEQFSTFQHGLESLGPGLNCSKLPSARRLEAPLRAGPGGGRSGPSRGI